jgi:hypothetical protein
MDNFERNWAIPAAFRDLAQQNVRQARSAYEQFMTAARQAQSVASTSGGSLTSAASEIQRRLVQFAEKNSEAGLALADELAKARDLNEWIAVYQQHAVRQSESYALQAQELGRLIAAAQPSR